MDERGVHGVVEDSPGVRVARVQLENGLNVRERVVQPALARPATATFT